jgi:hypothetical protein
MGNNIHPIFILAYDLIGEKLKENKLACGEAYIICERIYKDFLCSQYNDVEWSEYECLCEFVENINVGVYIHNYPYLKEDSTYER